MLPVDVLILDAKQAILQEQYRRFQTLQREGRWQEALQQFQVTLSCACDLLNGSLRTLEQLLSEQRKADHPIPPQAPPSDPPTL